MPMTRPYSLWNLRNYCEWQNHRFVSNKYVSRAGNTSNVTNNKTELWQTDRLTSLQKTPLQFAFYLLGVCPSISPLAFAVSFFFIFIPSLIVLRSHFYVSLNLLAVPIVWVSWRQSSFNLYVIKPFDNNYTCRRVNGVDRRPMQLWLPFLNNSNPI